MTVGLWSAPLRNAEGAPLVSLGLVYRSRAVVPLQGAILANGVTVVDASIDLVLPHVITGAITVWPIRISE